MEHRSKLGIPKAPPSNGATMNGSSAVSLTTATTGVLATQYATLAALLTAVAALPGAFALDCSQPAGSVPRRAFLYPTGAGTEGQTNLYDVYAVFRTDLQADGVMTQACGTATSVLGTDAITGAGTNQVWAKSCTFASSDYLESCTGGALEPTTFGGGTNGPADAAGLTLYDNGDAIAWIVVPRKGTATNAGTLARQWH